jgi:hypothetical protein
VIPSRTVEDGAPKSLDALDFWVVRMMKDASGGDHEVNFVPETTGGLQVPLLMPPRTFDDLFAEPNELIDLMGTCHVFEVRLDLLTR